MARPTVKYDESTSKLHTWWHGTEERNPHSRLAKPENVRRSAVYDVKVGIAESNDYYDSFVYASIPRNGNGKRKIFSPNDPDSDTLKDEDGISVEIDAGISMAWSQFEYSTAVEVKISRLGKPHFGLLSNVVIRPKTFTYDTRISDDGGLVIRVPYDPNGHDDETKPSVGEEPRNALLIFASPFIPHLIPDIKSGDVTVMNLGAIKQGSWGKSSVLYFPPGVYWMDEGTQEAPKLGQSHIKLDPATYWVYLAPGAYVKGAIEYTTQNESFLATGHGVLSGEHYVYQANHAEKYTAKKCDGNGLRMWYHKTTRKGQVWTCVGPTVASPPFNTMDFHNKHQEAVVHVSDYKQVGAFYFQTDGLQLYPNSVAKDIFYHVNDDAIKLYYSNVQVSRVTVWKCFNDPIIQMGWKSRNVMNVEIDSLYIIHSRYRKENDYPTAIIGANNFYVPHGQTESKKTIKPWYCIRNVRISNIVCEGVGPALLKINPLNGYKNFIVENVAYLDGLQEKYKIGESYIAYSPGQPEMDMDIRIRNWQIKNQPVTSKNFQHDQLGKFWPAGEY